MENADMVPVVAPEAQVVVHRVAAAQATKKLAEMVACPRVWSAATLDTACPDRPVPATVLADIVQAVEAVGEAAAVQATTTTTTSLPLLESLQHLLSTLPPSPPLQSHPSLPSTTIHSLHSALAPSLLALELVVTMETAAVAATAMVEATVVQLFCLVCSWVLLLCFLSFFELQLVCNSDVVQEQDIFRPFVTPARSFCRRLTFESMFERDGNNESCYHEFGGMVRWT
jgi:hypothetical protein